MIVVPLLLAVGFALGPVLTASSYGDATVLLRFADPAIAESSGLVASSTRNDVLFTHNDSGDRARFFAVGPNGTTLTTYTLPGVQARDWEDLARGPDEQGRSCLWLADIGDNNAVRNRGILVHRVREPVIDGRRRVNTAAPESFRLRYPDGPGDAETVLVHPRTGRLWIVTKPLAGAAQVYAAPARLDPDGPNLLTRVGEADVTGTGTEGGPGIGTLANLLVTAGSVSPDGRRVALRTYTDVYEWDIPSDDVGAAFSGRPVVSPLPPTRQGEGLTYSRDGRALLTSSEGVGAPVHRLVRASGEPSIAPGVETSPVDRAAPGPRWPTVALGVLVLVLAGVGAALLRTRRAGRG